ncbi:hypothetical protein V8G54_012737 [Vigna mungo]|uniref:Uncharacterized protein n=1 Tax=Vigna mungo TaxID=3915 RepID=A0AAQ3NUB1_VIGMU
MAQTSLCSRSLPFLLLLIIFLSFSAVHVPVTTADLKMRKLGAMASSPPSPKLGKPQMPGSQPSTPPFMTTRLSSIRENYVYMDGQAWVKELHQIAPNNLSVGVPLQVPPPRPKLEDHRTVKIKAKRVIKIHEKRAIRSAHQHSSTRTQGVAVRGSGIRDYESEKELSKGASFKSRARQECEHKSSMAWIMWMEDEVSVTFQQWVEEVDFS